MGYISTKDDLEFKIDLDGLPLYITPEGKLVQFRVDLETNIDPKNLDYEIIDGSIDVFVAEAKAAVDCLGAQIIFEGGFDFGVGGGIGMGKLKPNMMPVGAYVGPHPHVSLDPNLSEKTSILGMNIYEFINFLETHFKDYTIPNVKVEY